MNLPFSRSRTIRCPDGTTRIVYKDPAVAFPLFVRGWDGSVKAGVKSAPGTPLSVAGDLEGDYKSKMQQMLVEIDGESASLMMHFLGAYVAFTADPCNGADYLRRQVERINARHQDLAATRLQIKAVLQLAKIMPDDVARILELFNRTSQAFPGDSSPTATEVAIQHNREAARDWSLEHRDER